MNSILTLALALIGIPLFLLEVWTRYLAIMALYRAERAGTLPLLSRRLGMPLLYYGYLIDFLGQLLLTIVFLDLPRLHRKEWLMTHRLQRYVDGPDSWRRRFAVRIALDMLDPFDPKGHHIRHPQPVAAASEPTFGA